VQGLKIEDWVCRRGGVCVWSERWVRYAALICGMNSTAMLRNVLKHVEVLCG
jgi:hypothetical protein